MTNDAKIFSVKILLEEFLYGFYLMLCSIIVVCCCRLHILQTFSALGNLEKITVCHSDSGSLNISMTLLSYCRLRNQQSFMLLCLIFIAQFFFISLICQNTVLKIKCKMTVNGTCQRDIKLSSGCKQKDNEKWEAECGDGAQRKN